MTEWLMTTGWMMMGWMAASLSTEVHPAAEASNCTCNTENICIKRYTAPVAVLVHKCESVKKQQTKIFNKVVIVLCSTHPITKNVMLTKINNRNI